jgi:hypothetical protein
MISLDSKKSGLFFVQNNRLKKARASAVLHLDADSGDTQAFACEVSLQGRQQLPKFGGYGVGAHQQTPDAIFNGARLYARSQWGRQQIANGLETIGRLANPSHQQ